MKPEVYSELDLQKAKTEGIIAGLKMAVDLCADQGPAVKLMLKYEDQLRVLCGEEPQHRVLYMKSR